jgi:hypothetical protein
VAHGNASIRNSDDEGGDRHLQNQHSRGGQTLGRLQAEEHLREALRIP